jgi:hypothetical protein
MCVYVVFAVSGVLIWKNSDEATLSRGHVCLFIPGRGSSIRALRQEKGLSIFKE